jgi:hypothetical protein
MLLWGFTQHRLVFSHRRFGKNLWVPSSRIKQSEKNVAHCLTLDDGTERLPQNIINKLSIYTALNPRRMQNSTAEQILASYMQVFIFHWNTVECFGMFITKIKIPSLKFTRITCS